METNKFKNIKFEGEKIMGFEPYFNDFVRIATIDSEMKEVRPAHGYFYPHYYGKITKKWSLENGYNFNNN